MANIQISVECAGCGSSNLEVTKKEAVTEKHYTDYVITYRCRDCGKTKTIGVVNKNG